MRIKGHPVHMMLVHFPSALFPVHFLLRLYAYWQGHEMGETVLLVLGAGVAGGWLAVLSGSVEFVRLARAEDDALVRTAVIHAGINAVVTVYYTLVLAMTLQGKSPLSEGALWLEAIALALLVTGNAFGGAIVTRFLRF